MEKRQFMEICDLVFDFEEFGIKPSLEDIEEFRGRLRLKYYFNDDAGNSYEALFLLYPEDQSIGISLFQEYDPFKWSTVGFALIRCFPDCLYLEYSSGINFLKSIE